MRALAPGSSLIYGKDRGHQIGLESDHYDVVNYLRSGERVNAKFVQLLESPDFWKRVHDHLEHRPEIGFGNVSDGGEWVFDYGVRANNLLLSLLTAIDLSTVHLCVAV